MTDGARDQVLYLKHGIGEEGLQHASLARGVGLVLLEQFVKVAVLLAVGQDLQTVLVVAHKLLVDVQHWQQDVKQVSCEEDTSKITSFMVSICILMLEGLL